jgi:glycosyltransferase involved in cell wall biosynthesis
MRILMLTSSWPLHDGDFRGGFVEDLVLDLASRGINIDVAVPRPQELPEFIDYSAATDGMIKVHWLPAILPGRSAAFHGAGIESNLMRSPLSAFSLPPALAAFAAECMLMLPFVDVIVSNWLLPMGAVGAALSSFSGKPHLIIAHSGPPAPARVPPLSSILKKVVSSATSIACVSESVKSKIMAGVSSVDPDKLVVLPMGVDLKPSIEKKPDPDRPLNLFFAGRLVPIKGLDVLIMAVKGVDGFNVSVAGEGPSQRALESLSSLLHADIRFMGPLKRQDVMRQMCMSDLMVIPSRRGLFGREEGLPRVLLESWSVGLPVLAASTGGLKDAVGTFGGGLLFPPGDHTSLKERLIQINGDRGMLGELRRQALDAATSFSWHRLGPKWINWLSDGLSRG